MGEDVVGDCFEAVACDPSAGCKGDLRFADYGLGDFSRWENYLYRIRCRASRGSRVIDMDLRRINLNIGPRKSINERKSRAKKKANGANSWEKYWGRFTYRISRGIH